MDLEKFEQFKRKFDTNFAGKSSNSSNQTGPQIKWPSSSNQSRQRPDDDDDLYS